jgi:hypothetical protein
MGLDFKSSGLKKLGRFTLCYIVVRPTKAGTSMKKTGIVFLWLISVFASAQAQSEWQRHIDWAIQDTGPPDCPDLYDEAGASNCLGHGNRACLMQMAIAIAKKDDVRVAMRLTLITQCHNQEAQHAIADAGPEVVGDYLKTK